MSQYSRLYLIADPSLQSAAALQRASALAQASGASLHIVTIFELTTSMRRLDPTDQVQLREHALTQYRNWLEEQAGVLRTKGIQVSTDLICSNDPLEEILTQVAELQADMVIKGAQLDSELLRTFVTPLDWYLLKECPVPVHLVGAIIHPLPRTVVAAVDMAATEERAPGLNERIIHTAQGLALQCNAELHLLHVCDLGLAHFADVLSLAWATDYAEDLRAAMWSAFSAMADRFSVPPEHRHFLVGRRVHMVAEFIELKRADVLVMGRAQRHGLDKVIGSTAEHVLHQIPTSVLVVGTA
ncbi:universal stress protein [Metapseudomonas lalkuanensis]|nr:universal stress protein [Pseudomonas lalkuanensis]